MKKYIITFSVFLYAVVVPFLEINETHVFNPDWTPHVRIHEVWQLLTNSGIGLFCLWLVWIKKETKISIVLSLFVTGGFLVAYILKGYYGGSMQYLDGSEKTLLGTNIGVLGFGIAFMLLLVVIALNKNMKYFKYLFVFLTLLSVYTSCQDSEKSNLILLSNQIPTDTALIFGQGIISTDNYEFAITFNLEMDELYFTRRKPEEDNEIYTIKLVDGKWSEPELAFFSTNKGWDFEPHINPKGNRLYFGSTRPLSDTLKSSGLHQWYSEKNENGWSKPIPMEKPFVDRFVMYLTSSENGNLYFTSGEKGDKPEDWVIYNSINEAGQYRSVKRMGNKINFSGKYIAHPYIAPDESYIIYDGESHSGYGDNDLYISFNKNGAWTEAHNLGPEINTDQTEMCPSVSPDGRYLFFHRGGDDKGDIYWIDFRPIKENILKNNNSN